MALNELAKSEITDRAVAEFLKNGIQSFTIHGLTEIAGISSKTVYKLFGDKSGLLKSCLQQHYAQMHEELVRIAESASNEVEELLKTLYRITELEFEVNPTFYSDLNKYYPAIQDEIKGTAEKAVEFFLQKIENGQKNGLFISSINKEVTLFTLQHIYAGITRDRIYQELNLSHQVLISNSVLIFIRGLCTPLGLLKLEEYKTNNSN